MYTNFLRKLRKNYIECRRQEITEGYKNNRDPYPYRTNNPMTAYEGEFLLIILFPYILYYKVTYSHLKWLLYIE